jgi:CheY-like chemotaxis protein
MSIKVLVADDSITIQKVIGIIFGGDEYSLTVVDNGKAAVEKAREINPDILLIDALMPGMTGYEVAEQVRATPELAAKPILILTGSFEPFDEEKAKKCGADDFIAKPFESQQIITKVKELLELGNSRALTVQTSSQQPDSETLHEQGPEFSAPDTDSPTPAFTQQSEAPSDIWNAFTPDVETPFETSAAPVIASLETAAEPDVFAIVSEENDSQLVQTAAPAHTSPQHTGSQWVPVEENTFEFEEETIAEPPETTFCEEPLEKAFGDISFENEAVTPSAPDVAIIPEPGFADIDISAPMFEAPVVPLEPFTPLADPTPVTPVVAPPVDSAPVIPAVATAAAVPSMLTEEQLKAALSGASKEVIERIVWEVVPDLAEALIREAIRKIKEGI